MRMALTSAVSPNRFSMPFTAQDVTAQDVDGAESVPLPRGNTTALFNLVLILVLIREFVLLLFF